MNSYQTFLLLDTVQLYISDDSLTKEPVIGIQTGFQRPTYCFCANSPGINDGQRRREQSAVVARAAERSSVRRLTRREIPCFSDLIPAHQTALM